MSRRFFVAAALVSMIAAPGAARVAQAQDRAALDFSSALSNTVVPSANLAATPLPESFSRPLRTSRPSALLAGLYASTLTMQALDVHSTLKAFGAGAVEANPVMSGITKNKMAFVMLKAGIATSTVLAAHNMAKTNKVAAIATLVAINSAYAMIVEHNYAVARRLQ